MAGLTIVTLAVGDRTRRITVTGGSDVDELRALICAAFQLPATTRTAPVALIARDTNVLVPLSVACARPDSLQAPAYGVLCVGGQLLLNEEPAGDLESEDDEDTETESSEEEEQQVAPSTDDAVSEVTTEAGARPTYRIRSIDRTVWMSRTTPCRASRSRTYAATGWSATR